MAGTVPSSTVSPKIRSGRTPVGQGWDIDPEEQKEGVFIEVNTTSAGFTSIPTYVVSLGAELGGGDGTRHWKATGVSSIYPPKGLGNDLKRGFRVYIRSAEGGNKIDGKVLDKAFPTDHRWYINWIGVQ